MVQAKKQKFFLLCRQYIFLTQTIAGLRFNTNQKLAEDIDFRLRAMRSINRGAITSSVTHMYRMRASSLSHSGSDHPYDIQCYMSLLGQLHEFPQAGREAIEYLALKSWWNCICIALADNNFDNNKSFLDAAYHQISSHHFQTDIIKKYRLKLMLFSLGEWALRLYMSFRKTKRPLLSSGNFFP